jgi:hypothetical protein
MTSPDLPARIDRAALERIIQRAAELQTGEREIGDALTPEDVLQLGREVGIPERYLQQAMLEERTRLAPAASGGVLDRVIGPAVVTAQRVVRGAPDEIEARLLRWIEDQELLAIQRQQPGRITWEPLRGMQVALRRSAAVLGTRRRPFMLQRANLVSATILPLEPGYCHVTLGAELRNTRGSVLGGAAACASLGLAAAAALAVMTPFWWFAVAPVPLGLGLAWGVARQYPPVVERTRLGLERALDHLERGEVKPSHVLPPGTPGLIGAILDEVRKALR